jgi:ATP-dependent RNA helicase DeaD
MLFSATVSREIEKLAGKFLHNPKNVQLASTVKPIFLRQTYCTVTPERKIDLLAGLLKEERHLAIVFCNRKHITVKVAKKLSGMGIHARCLNGNMSQPQRERVTNEFRQNKFNVLVATDVAARGLDIDNVSHVYNYEIPKDVDSYTHRVGRTARAGKNGEAISLVATEDEKKFFQQILFKYRGEISLRDVGETISLPVKVGISKPEHNERKSRAPWKKKWQRVMNHEGGRH